MAIGWWCHPSSLFSPHYDTFRDLVHAKKTFLPMHLPHNSCPLLDTLTVTVRPCMVIPRNLNLLSILPVNICLPPLLHITIRYLNATWMHLYQIWQWAKGWEVKNSLQTCAKQGRCLNGDVRHTNYPCHETHIDETGTMGPSHAAFWWVVFVIVPEARMWSEYVVNHKIVQNPQYKLAFFAVQHPVFCGWSLCLPSSLEYDLLSIFQLVLMGFQTNYIHLNESVYASFPVFICALKLFWSWHYRNGYLDKFVCLFWTWGFTRVLS